MAVTIPVVRYKANLIWLMLAKNNFRFQ